MLPHRLIWTVKSLLKLFQRFSCGDRSLSGGSARRSKAWVVPCCVEWLVRQLARQEMICHSSLMWCLKQTAVTDCGCAASTPCQQQQQQRRHAAVSAAHDVSQCMTNTLQPLSAQYLPLNSVNTCTPILPSFNINCSWIRHSTIHIRSPVYMEYSGVTLCPWAFFCSFLNPYLRNTQSEIRKIGKDACHIDLKFISRGITKAGGIEGRLPQVQQWRGTKHIYICCKHHSA